MESPVGQTAGVPRLLDIWSNWAYGAGGDLDATAGFFFCGVAILARQLAPYRSVFRPFPVNGLEFAPCIAGPAGSDADHDDSIPHFAVGNHSTERSRPEFLQ